MRAGGSEGKGREMHCVRAQADIRKEKSRKDLREMRSVAESGCQQLQPKSKMNTSDLAAALEILGSNQGNAIEQLQEALMFQAAKDVIAALHPDHQEECEALSDEIATAVESYEEINCPTEGWDYWFGDSTPFRAYQNALRLYNLTA
jgi:hypothetical protein